MHVYVMRRCLQSCVVFVAILVIVFLMLQITGDPAAVLMPLDASAEDLEAFRHGLPPHGGFAIGLERLVSLLFELPNVRLASLFPRDINRLAP